MIGWYVVLVLQTLVILWLLYRHEHRGGGQAPAVTRPMEATRMRNKKKRKPVGVRRRVATPESKCDERSVETEGYKTEETNAEEDPAPTLRVGDPAGEGACLGDERKPGTVGPTRLDEEKREEKAEDKNEKKEEEEEEKEEKEEKGEKEEKEAKDNTKEEIKDDKVAATEKAEEKTEETAEKTEEKMENKEDGDLEKEEQASEKDKKPTEDDLVVLNDLLQELLSHKTDLDGYDDTQRHEMLTRLRQSLLSRYEFSEVVNILLDGGVSLEGLLNDAAAERGEAREDERDRVVEDDVPASSPVLVVSVQFWKACEDEDVRTAQQLLENGEVNVDMFNDRGETALLAASRSDHKDIVRLLLVHGADVHARSFDSGETVLHLADDPIVVKMLLEANGDPNATDWRGNTPLHRAVSRLNNEKAVMLLEHGAKGDTVNMAGAAPIHCLLREMDPDPDDIDSIAQGHDTAQALVLAGIKWDDACDEAVGAEGIIRFGFRVAVLWWIDEHARGTRQLTNIPEEVFQRGPSSVEQYLAALHASNKVVFRRKVCVVGPSFWGKTSLVKSISKGYPSLEHPEDRTIGIDQFPLLFSKKAISDEELLLAACEDGDIEAIRLLIMAKRVDLRATAKWLPVDNEEPRHYHDARGSTPLLYAVKNGRADILQLLVESGMDPNIRVAENPPTLWFAIVQGNAPAMQILLAAGADPNATMSTDDSTFLHYALGTGFPEGARLLVDYGAQVNVADEHGNTPLHFCYACPEVTNALLKAEANIHVTNEEGHTPFHRLVKKVVKRLSQKSEGVSVLAGLQFAAQALVSAGARWDDKCQELADGKGDTSHTFREAVFVWTEQQTRGVELTTFPVELYARGPETMREFLAHPEQTHPPLHLTILQRQMLGMKALLAAGADVNEPDKSGQSPLHTAVRLGFAEGAQLLLESNAHVNVADKDGNTPLHYCCECLELIPALSKFGANPNASNKDGDTPFHLLVKKAVTREQKTFRYIASVDSYAAFQALISCGATWDTRCDEVIEEEDDALRVFREVIMLWTEERAQGKQFTAVPVDAYERDPTRIRTYGVRNDRLRRTWQPPSEVTTETSLSILTIPESLTENQGERVIGQDHPEYISMDLTSSGPCGSTSKPLETSDQPTGTTTGAEANSSTPVKVHDIQRHHEVTFWDFAGQEAYQVAHSAYFSKRTLYLVCVDLRAYAVAQLQATLRADKDRDVDRLMNEFVESKILRWVRLILARQPDAEFVFIGTKADVLARTKHRIDQSYEDLKMRVKRFAESIESKSCDKDERLRRLHLAGASLTETTKDRLSSRALDASAKRLQNLEWLTVDCTSEASIHMARKAIEEMIVKSKRSFQMPDLYSQVLEHLMEQRTNLASKRPSDQVATAFVEADHVTAALRNELPDQAGNLYDEACCTILRTCVCK